MDEAARRRATRYWIEILRLLLAFPVAYGAVKVFQGPIESTCPPSEVNPGQTSGLCAGISGLYAAVLGFVGWIVLSVIAEVIWRRRRKRRLADRPAQPS